MQSSIDEQQRTKLAATGQILIELAGLEQKKATGFSNTCEERRAAELAADAVGALDTCAGILRSMTKN